VRNALELADDNEFDALDLKSIIFPIMGTGTGRADTALMARKLIQAAVNHLVRKPPCRIERVYFVARTEEQLEACQLALEDATEVTIAE
jgi:O-acetyl-ADP-ribose deacetylase (regulator of RNase III)